MSSFGGAVKLTGESEYRQALKNITQNLREVSSQLQLNTAQYDSNDKSVANLAKQEQDLNKIYKTQEGEVAKLRSVYSDFSQKVNEQTKAHKELEDKYKSEKAELDRIGKTLGTTSKEYQDQKQKVDALEKAVAKSRQENDNNRNALSRMGTALNKAETDLIKTAKQMDNLGNETKETSEQVKGAGDGFTVFKGVLAGLATKAITTAISGLKSLASAVISVGKQALTSYADYEQLIGGVETLFKDSAPIVEEYANNAYKSAGLSANKYMETVTGFSASLLQSLDGDTKKTAEYANRAVIDMSDNANKMGTSIEMIQNAYQGFAKQNYTMLDNLKLGYGGTKTEMQRLIQDASKLTEVQKELGVTVDANDMSFGNIVNAISVVQKNMGIMGTTAKEASETISGSVASMKSAWSNLLTGIADDNANFDQLINNFVDSLLTVGKNILPRIKTIIQGIGKTISQLLTTLVPEIVKEIPPLIKELIPVLTGAVKQAIESIAQVLPELANTLAELVPQVVEMIISMLPQLIEVGIQAILNLAKGITKALPKLIAMIPKIIGDIQKTFMANLPEIILVGIDLLLALVNGIIDAIPQLIENVDVVIDTFINALMDNLPQLITAGIKLLIALVKGIVVALPQLASMTPRIILTLVTKLLEHVPEIVQTGVEILKSFVSGILSKMENVKNSAQEIIKNIIEKVKQLPSQMLQQGKQVVQSLINGISSFISSLRTKVQEVATTIINKVKEIPSQMISIGTNIVQGIWNGISGSLEWIKGKIKEWCGNVVDFCKRVLGINSPSKVMADGVGKYMAMGIGVGFQDEMKAVEKQMQDAIPTNFDTTANLTGISGNSSFGTKNSFTFDSMVLAFQEALASMKIELDDEEAGRFVRKTVENAIYT